MDGQKKRVLIVDDMEINQQLAKAIVEAKDFTADLAMNGLEALEALKKKDYDLILMDIQMPYMDGVEATRAIRALEDPVKRAIPIIALTANGGEVNAAKYLEAGINDCLCKPIDERHLCSVMEKYTGVGCPGQASLEEGASEPGSKYSGNSGSMETSGSSLNTPGRSTESSDSSSKFSRNSTESQGRSTELQTTDAFNSINSIATGSGVPDQPLYDIRLVKELSGGDMEFVKKMLVLFCDTMPVNMKQLSCAAECGDWEGTWKAAHKMKSTIDSMQIHSIRGLIREIEEGAKKGEGLETIPGKVRQVNSVLEQCMVQVKREL